MSATLNVHMQCLCQYVFSSCQWADQPCSMVLGFVWADYLLLWMRMSCTDMKDYKAFITVFCYQMQLGFKVSRSSLYVRGQCFLMCPHITGPACIIFQLLRKINVNVCVEIHWAWKARGTESSPEMEAQTVSFCKNKCLYAQRLNICGVTSNVMGCHTCMGTVYENRFHHIQVHL